MLLQDKYNIGVLTLKARLSSVFKPRHINSIFTVNTPILYIYVKKRDFTNQSLQKVELKIKLKSRHCILSS